MVSTNDSMFEDSLLDLGGTLSSVGSVASFRETAWNTARFQQSVHDADKETIVADETSKAAKARAVVEIVRLEHLLRIRKARPFVPPWPKGKLKPRQTSDTSQRVLDLERQLKNGSIAPEQVGNTYLKLGSELLALRHVKKARNAFEQAITTTQKRSVKRKAHLIITHMLLRGKGKGSSVVEGLERHMRGWLRLSQNTTRALGSLQSKLKFREFMNDFRLQLLNDATMEPDCPLSIHRELAEMHIDAHRYEDALDHILRYVHADPALLEGPLGSHQEQADEAGKSTPVARQASFASLPEDSSVYRRANSGYMGPPSAVRGDDSAVSSEPHAQDSASSLAASSLQSVPTTITDTLADQSSLFVRSRMEHGSVARSPSNLHSPSHLRSVVYAEQDEEGSEGSSVWTDATSEISAAPVTRDAGWQPLSTVRTAPAFSLGGRIPRPAPNHRKNPGPGAYNVPSAFGKQPAAGRKNAPAAKFQGRSAGGSMYYRNIVATPFEPGPADQNLRSSLGPQVRSDYVNTGSAKLLSRTFGETKHDQKMMASAKVPGPGAYDTVRYNRRRVRSRQLKQDKTASPQNGKVAASVKKPKAEEVSLGEWRPASGLGGQPLGGSMAAVMSCPDSEFEFVDDNGEVIPLQVLTAALSKAEDAATSEAASDRDDDAISMRQTLQSISEMPDGDNEDAPSSPTMPQSPTLQRPRSSGVQRRDDMVAFAPSLEGMLPGGTPAEVSRPAELDSGKALDEQLDAQDAAAGEQSEDVEGGEGGAGGQAVPEAEASQPELALADATADEGEAAPAQQQAPRPSSRAKSRRRKPPRRNQKPITSDPKEFVSSLTRTSVFSATSRELGSERSDSGSVGTDRGYGRTGSSRGTRRRGVTLHHPGDPDYPFQTTGGRFAFVRRWEYKDTELIHAGEAPGPGRYHAELRAATDNDAPKFTMYGRLGGQKVVASLSELGAGSCGMDYSGFGEQVDASKPTAGKSRFGGRDSSHADLLKMTEVLAHHNLHDKQMKKRKGVRPLKSSDHSLKGLPGPGTYPVRSFTKDITDKFNTSKTALANARRHKARRLYR